jgi:serine/threonine protein kinase
MKSEQWQQLDRLFHVALERKPDERAAFLDEACAGDEALRREVKALLTAHEEAGSFIENPAFKVEAQALAGEQARQKANSIVGQIIAHYRIIEPLGSGGMGDVYLAQDMTLGRQVALKLLPARFTGDAELLRRFEQEARAASALNHPNILTIYEIGYADSVRYIATEFIAGVTLRARMAGKPMKTGETLNVALQVASALAAAHARGIVHRDIKPENIMISSASQLVQRETFIKVLDFGIAKLTESHVSDTETPTRPLVSTSHGVTMGTAPYMSPEQVRGDRVDARTDIWSLGAVLYEMLAGQMPFVGEKAQDVNASILKDESLPLAAEIPDRLKWLVKKALRKDREDRYQTAREMCSDLLDLLEQETETQKIERSAQANVRGMIAENSQASAREVKIGGEFAARSTSSAEYIISKIKPHKRGALIALMTLLVTMAGMVFGLYEFISGNRPRSGIPFQSFQATRLTVTGKSPGAAISPDGKTVAYVVDEAEQQSIWVRDISTSSEVQIIPPTESELIEPTFSPDGGHIYFLKRNKNELITGVYQVPVFGGAPKRIVEDAYSSVGFSADGKQIAFIALTAEETHLMIANADGSGVRPLAKRKLSEGFVDDAPAWSSDGHAVFCAISNTDGNDSYLSVVRIRLADGSEERFGSKRWPGINYLARFRDDGLLVASSGKIWFLSANGEARKVIDDSNRYITVTVSDDGRRVVAVHNGLQHFNIWTKLPGDGGSLTQVTNTIGNNGGATWTPDGKILYTSNASGSMDIWIMDRDGGNKRQLTANAGWNYYTSITADGRYIVFVSNRSGAPSVWRMDADGGNAKELASGEREPWPYCSPDGKWVVYEYGLFSTLWKVPLLGGEPTKLTDNYAGSPAVSPDGKLVACVYFEKVNSPARLAIIPIEGGPPVKLFDLPATFNAISGHNIRWAADGRAVTYIATRGGDSNIWSQPLDGSPPKQLTDFKSEQMVFFNWSRDGKDLAFTRGSPIRDLVLISDSTNHQ